MSIEAATFIADFQALNPPSTDPRSQGDDHLRLIKQVLQNSFGGSSRQFQIPSVAVISTSSSVTKANGESVLYTSTASGAVTLTLPTLVAGDAGWKVRVIKTSSDANPIFIVPPTGTINSGGVAGLAKARRCIPGVQITVIWDGAAWFVTRVHALPIGSCIEFHGSALPAGFEWPNGQTLASVATNYPEYNAAIGSGVTLDKRGRLGIALDNLGGAAAGRLAGGIITGTAVGNVGGTDTVLLDATMIPAHRHSVFLNDPGHTHNFVQNGVPTSSVNTNGPASFVYQAAGAQGAQQLPTTIQSNTTGITVRDTTGGGGTANQTALTGGGLAHSNLQPSIMVSQILVVE